MHLYLATHIGFTASSTPLFSTKLLIALQFSLFLYLSNGSFATSLTLKPFFSRGSFFRAFTRISIRVGLIFALSRCGRFFLFLLLAKMLCNLSVLVGSAIHNVHNTLKGCNTGTFNGFQQTGIANKSNCVYVVRCACMRTAPTDLQWLLPNFIFAGLIFAVLSFSAKYAKIKPPRK